MKRFIAFAAVVLAVTTHAQAQANSAAKFSVAGIPVIFKPIRANDVVAVRLYLKGGSSNLTPATSGIESLMLESAIHGTTKYTRDAFVEKSVETGTTINSEAGYDYSVLTLQGVREHWNEAWDLFAEAALHPTFPASEVDLVRSQLVDDLKRIPDDPDTYLTYLADSSLYAGHPYAVRPGGSATSLAAISRDALVSWHRQRFSKENLLIVVVGNVTRADLEKKIAASFGGLPATGGTAVTVSALGSITPDVMVVKRELPTNYITRY